MNRTRRLLLQASLVASMGAVSLVTAPKVEAAAVLYCQTAVHCEIDCAATNDAMCDTCLGGNNTQVCVYDGGCDYATNGHAPFSYYCGFAS